MTEIQPGVPLHVIKQYDRDHGLLEEFIDINLKLFKAFITENALQIYDIKGFVLPRDVLVERLESTTSKTIHEVDDLMIIRILTFLEDETRYIAEIIQGEFKVLHDFSKTGIVRDPQYFGYACQRYLVRMLDSRLEWIEYRRFREFKLEIQIRSMLQHTWAEIQEVLYPSHRLAHMAPELLRDGARVVSFLELADRELNRIHANKTPASQPKPETMVTQTTPIIDPIPAPSQTHQEAEENTVPLTIAPAPTPEQPSANPTVAETIIIATPVSEVVITPEELARTQQALEAFKEKLTNWVLGNVSVRLIDRDIADIYDVPLRFDESFLTGLAGANGHLEDLEDGDLEKVLLDNTARVKELARKTFGEPGKVALTHMARGAALLSLGRLLAERMGAGRISLAGLEVAQTLLVQNNNSPASA
ncbi:MAG: hypothetical protein HQL07_17320 [Nitrospirae bacterium]|nr:hypothetical protein [Magnetococcales bacterium]HAT49708.1 hypothetical protein [Alphaproteobacteria bacterium]